MCPLCVASVAQRRVSDAQGLASSAQELAGAVCGGAWAAQEHYSVDPYVKQQWDLFQGATE